MTETDAGAGFDLYVLRNFLDAEACGELLGELRRASTAAAEVYGHGESGGVDERVRKAARLAPSRANVTDFAASSASLIAAAVPMS